ncbi:hypothetical protein BKA65DRAFT_483561 [Rhexocercosporidium sp. MPI-PUGE-AT-0058]|nr:hypothetical protein BKA65DRAFT_483561 [Rhexocercosporidium sp. MPI-PUGE-AT-0058]
MTTNTPVDVEEFFLRFPDWPEDSLEHRIDIEAGSRWTIRDIGTFQVLRVDRGKDFPIWLQNRYIEARERVKESNDIQRVIRLLDRYLRDVFPTAQISQQSSQRSSSSGPPSSPLEPPPKRIRGQRYSDSYHPSNDPVDESEQSRYDEQVKAEPVTNACFYHFLECVTEKTRREGDDGFRLEWALAQDSFHVRTLHAHFSSKNDGSLVHRGNISGQWKRRSNISYCSIEMSYRSLLIGSI